MIDVVSVSKDIEKKIDLLEKGRNGLEQLARTKAKTIGEYDKALQIAILKLKDDGKLPATLIEKVAKGECWKERAEMELADALYKIHVVKLDTIQAELNGYQSIYRHLENR